RPPYHVQLPSNFKLSAGTAIGSEKLHRPQRELPLTQHLSHHFAYGTGRADDGHAWQHESSPLEKTLGAKHSSLGGKWRDGKRGHWLRTACIRALAMPRRGSESRSAGNDRGLSVQSAETSQITFDDGFI